jgi:hypothetical protein
MRRRALTDRETHVIHLGTEFEAQKHVLDLWPFKTDQSDRLRSWALNGNHDMYSGGHGYFQTTIGDQRFSRQAVNGRPTSWFHLKGSTWDVIGLDTAYKDPVAALRPAICSCSGGWAFCMDPSLSTSTISSAPATGGCSC